MHFDISYSSLYAAGARAIAEGLKGNQVVTELNISGNGMGKISKYEPRDKSGVAAFADVIAGMGALTSLNLSSNNLEVVGAKIFAEAIKVTNRSFWYRFHADLTCHSTAVVCRYPKDNGAIFSVRKDVLVSFYEQHDAQYADHTDQFLQEYSAQELVDWCQEAYGSSPTTTPKAKGALTKLDIRGNRIPSKQEGGLQRICAAAGIELAI
jgi:hypothetical protein